MNKIDKRETAILLSKLDEEINLKCMELKEKQKEIKQKNLFFISCLSIIVLFILQMFFSLFNMNYIITMLIYQFIALILIVPIILNKKGGAV